MKVTDQWLYENMPVVDAAMISALESEMDETYRFSDVFEKKMDKLIQKEKRFWHNAYRKSYRRAAVVALCTVGGLLALSVNIEADRLFHFDSTKSVRDERITYSYERENAPQDIIYMEPEVLDGYVEKSRKEAEDTLTISYENDRGDHIYWNQILVRDSMNLILGGTTYDHPVTRTVNGNTLFINLSEDGTSSAYYEYGESIFLLHADDLTIEQICTLYESMK